MSQRKKLLLNFSPALGATLALVLVSGNNVPGMGFSQRTVTESLAESLAQTLPPLYDGFPVEIAPVRQIAQFPVYTFLESVAIAPDGTLFVTSHEDGKILQLQPGADPKIYTEIAGKVAGLAFAPNGDLLVTGWDAAGVPTVFQVSGDGAVSVLAVLPDAMFLNGLTKLEGDRYLIADSYRGAIWELNATTGAARIWLEDPLLARATSESVTPGVNGLKLYDGVLYASNSDRAHLVRIPLQENGQPGEPEVFLQNAVVDDFAFDVDGNLYGATHVFNSIVRITPDGDVTTIATAAQGVTGSTAVAFGRQEGDRLGIYVVTNGGMFLPPATGVVPAEVVWLEVGAEGLVP